jgi:hypothetical protein
MDRQQEFDKALETAGALEQMVNTNGFEFVKNYYKNRLQGFTNEVLTSDRPWAEFEAERNRLSGINQLLGEIKSHIDLLEKERERQRSEKTSE